MRILALGFALLLVNTAPAQPGNGYVKDLEAVRAILEKTPSYKDQIREKKLSDFNELFEKLKADSLVTIGTYRYFYNLSQLFFPIRDNHLGFYGIDSAAQFPVFHGNIDSLKFLLSTKQRDSLEGIYHYDEFYTVGLFKAGKEEYRGVVLQSTIPAWIPGQVVIHLYELEPGYYKAIYAHPKLKYFTLYPIEKYSNGSLVNSYFYSSFTEKTYSRNPKEPDRVNLPRDRNEFELKTLVPGIQYLQLKHFSAHPSSMQRSQSFYDSIENKLTEPNLVVDLRNNQGGAEKASAKFYKLLNNYALTGRIYVLVNNGTMSQGEIFTLQLKKLPNVTVLGQTTKGMLVYGSNYGKRVKLPSGAYEIYVTDMRGDSRLVPYENYGVKPDIFLSPESDWTGQVMQIINNR